MASQTVEAKLLEASHWINGEWISEGTGKESVDPASGIVIGHYSMATLDDVHRFCGGCEEGVSFDQLER